MKKLLPLIAITVILTGCQNPYLVSKTTTLLGTRVALRQMPESRPFLQAAAPVICDAAKSGTNISSVALIDKLEQLPEESRDVALVLNLILTSWLSLDPDNKDRQESLLGVCDGLNLGLSMGAQPLGSPYVRGR